jgi:hypothetical protein
MNQELATSHDFYLPGLCYLHEPAIADPTDQIPFPVLSSQPTSLIPNLALFMVALHFPSLLFLILAQIYHQNLFNSSTSKQTAKSRFNQRLLPFVDPWKPPPTPLRSFWK